MVRLSWLVPFVGLVLGGCMSIPPPSPTMQCDFKRYPLEVDHPPGGNAASLADYGPSLSSVLAGGEESDGIFPPVPRPMLYLSGGSQHGAFGAGFLEGWAGEDGLPEFQTVTGISTGAILATTAFIGRPGVAVERYSITHEKELLDPFIKLDRKGDIPLTAFPKILKKGAVADLAPLRRQLWAVMDDDVLRAVAKRGDDRRRLLVGVVDVDTGRALALDLTHMAARYRTAKDQGDKKESERFRHCYAEAIVASSAVPLAALPVFIDNRMYIDGGARFGAFADEVARAIERQRTAVAARNAGRRRTRNDSPAEQAPRVYLIMNGDQEIPEKCSKAGWKEGTPCPENDPLGDRVGAHRNWSLLALAMRSEEILVNQVYRFSADYIVRRFGTDGRVHFAKIDPDMLSHKATIVDPDLETGAVTDSCENWYKRDKKLLNPIQFYPRYMRCLIDYGRMRGLRSNWSAHRD